MLIPFVAKVQALQMEKFSKLWLPNTSTPSDWKRCYKRLRLSPPKKRKGHRETGVASSVPANVFPVAITLETAAPYLALRFANQQCSKPVLCSKSRFPQNPNIISVNRSLVINPRGRPRTRTSIHPHTLFDDDSSTPIPKAILAQASSKSAPRQ